MRRPERILGTVLLEHDGVGSRESSRLRPPFRGSRCDREGIGLDGHEGEARERDRGRQIRARQRCLSEELEFVSVHGPSHDQRDDSDGEPEGVRREQAGRVPGIDGLRERNPEAEHEEPAQDVPFVRRCDRPSLDGGEVGQDRDWDQEEEGNGPPSRQCLSMDEAQDEDGRECVREEDDPQSHIIAKGRQDPLVRPDEGRTECEVRKAARGVRGLEPGPTAPDCDEGEQPCVHRNPREDCRA